LKVAVIGSSGGMGRFFTEYFLLQGHEVTGSDLRKATVRDPRFVSALSNREAVQGADAVLVATPIDTTVETVREVAPKLKRGATVIEISSLKRKIIGRLRPMLAKRGVTLLSLHPLFGPSLASSEGMKICVIPTSPKSRELAQGLFPDAILIPMKEREHDRAMAVVLSLTHLVNIAYAGTIAKHFGAERFRSLETPTSSVQLSLAEGVLSQDPSLYSYIQLENEFSARFAGELIEQLTVFKRMIEKKQRKAFERRFSALARRYADDSKTAMERVYEAFEVKQSR